jgi:carbamoyl-phosphate synthase small subunit
VQYHPEAAAGPHDAAYLFDRFVELMAPPVVEEVAQQPSRDQGTRGWDPTTTAPTTGEDA